MRVSLSMSYQTVVMLDVVLGAIPDWSRLRRLIDTPEYRELQRIATTTRTRAEAASAARRAQDGQMKAERAAENAKRRADYRAACEEAIANGRRWNSPKQAKAFGLSQPVALEIARAVRSSAGRKSSLSGDQVREVVDVYVTLVRARLWGRREHIPLLAKRMGVTIAAVEAAIPVARQRYHEMHAADRPSTADERAAARRVLCSLGVRGYAPPSLEAS